MHTLDRLQELKVEFPCVLNIVASDKHLAAF